MALPRQSFQLIARHNVHMAPSRSMAPQCFDATDGSQGRALPEVCWAAAFECGSGVCEAAAFDSQLAGRAVPPLLTASQFARIQSGSSQAPLPHKMPAKQV